MHTQFAGFFKHTLLGQQAERMIRLCVHCGFCNAACPTYRVTGDELDGPRGRIYLIKNLLEGQKADAAQTHLDRCLQCRACESACPSGVPYGALQTIGRRLCAEQTRPPWPRELKQRLLNAVLPWPQRAARLFAVLRLLRPLLPHALKRKLGTPPAPGPWPEVRHTRRMLVLEGCVQPLLTPRVNAAAARVFDRLGISLIALRPAACCGALPQHFGAEEAAPAMMRRIIDACWPYVEDGIEAIVSTASGCGLQVKQYGALLRDDAQYAEKAARISALCRDAVEIVAGESAQLAPLAATQSIAVHTPCTLQHGQQLSGTLEQVLTALGAVLTEVRDAEQCCGSAGAYSLLEPKLAAAVRQNKLAGLLIGQPSAIVSANVGCQLYLQEQTELPVLHWLEWLEMNLRRD